VGRIYIALAGPSGTQVRRIMGGLHRIENKELAVEAALALLEAFLTGSPPPGEPAEDP
jgi:nicotinamide mononucleotide (NMN) deamidase PncC